MNAELEFTDDDVAQMKADMDAQDAEADAAATNVAMDGSLMQLMAEFEELTAIIDSLDEQLKAKKARKEVLKKRLIPDMMLEMGIVKPDGKASMSLASGATVFLKTDTYVNFDKKDEAKVLDWLRSTNAGTLVKTTVSNSALRGHVVELQEQGDPVPAFLKVYRETTANLRAAKAAKL